MRRVFVVLVLLAVMAGLQTLKADSSGAADPMTLAAIGFVVLAAFAVAELGADLSLPKVTGYILSGVLLGPHVANVLSAPVVQEMRMFSTLALGLIATTAGLELDLPTLRRLARTLAATVLAKIVLGVAIVGGTLVGLELAFGWLGLTNTNATLAMGLVFAALSLGTSPAIAIAIIEESKAKGRLSDLVLGAAVLKDVVVVVCLAVAISTARVLTEGGALRLDVFIHVGQELGASIAAGAVLGGLFIAYIRFIRAEMLLFVAASILVTAEISAALHLELLLVFIVAGFVVRNFSDYEHDLLHALQTVSLPVFIVFFTNAGAGVDLGATWSLLPMALALCAARILAYVLASRFGAWAGGETPAVGKLAWLAYLPQAGVTLGLVGLAGAQLPSLAAPIGALGMAVVAINLLAGPLTLRVALRRHGDLPDESPEKEAAADEAEVAPAEGTVSELDNPKLAGLLAETVAHARTNLDALQRDQLDVWLDQWCERFRSETTTSSTRADELARLAAIVDRIEAHEGPRRADAFAGTFDTLAESLASLPEALEVPLEDGLRRVGKDDGLRDRWRKRTATLGALVRGRASRRTRVVPVALTMRAAFDLRVAELIEGLARGWQRFEIETYELVNQAALGTRDADFSSTVDALAQRLRDDWRERIAHALRSGTVEASRHLACLGAPTHPAARLRYSAIEGDVIAALDRTRDDSLAWDASRRGALNLVSATVGILLARARLADTLHSTVIEPGDAVFTAIHEELDAQLGRVDRVLAELREAEVLDDDAWERAQMAADAFLPRPAHKRLRTVANKLRAVTSSRTVANAVSEFVRDHEGTVNMLPSLREVRDAERPATVALSAVDLGELHQVRVSGSLLPKLESALETAARHFVYVRHEMGESAQLAHFVVENTRKDLEDGDASEVRKTLVANLQHVRERLAAAIEIVDTRWHEQRDAIEHVVLDTGDELLDALFAVTVAPSVRSQVRARLRDIPAIARALASVDTGWARVRRLAAATRHFVVDSWHTRAAVDGAWTAVGGGLNAAAIRRHVEARYQGRVDPDLPSLYAPLFAVDTLRDPRFFATHRDALKLVIDTERAWRADSGHGNAVLVTGSCGSGRSSLLAAAELKLGTRRIAALRSRGATEPADWLAALAGELGTPRAEYAAVAHTLGRGKGLVVIDDLHTWFTPTRAGLDALAQWLSLVVETSSTTLWLVTCLDETWDLIEGPSGARAVFGDVARLPALGPRSLSSVIASRHDLSGLPVTYPQTPWSRWLPRVRQASPRAEYLRRLAAASGGNLRRALRLWLDHARAGTGNSVDMRRLDNLSPGLPFLRQLDTVQIAALSALIRHGSLQPATLVELLGEDATSLERHMHFLHAAGLVARQHDEAVWYQVRSEVTDDLCASLAALGAFSERRALA